MVTESGAVKLLDFGLAKLFEGPAAAMEDTPTEMPTAVSPGAAASNQLTEEGKILGTVAYMSPEQAEGKAIDHRSDVFSLGIMLYEMATGVRPFAGDTKVSVISAVVKDTPASVTELNARLPRHLGRIIKRCLEKDIKRRPQTALDVRNELEDLKGEVDSGELAASGVHAAPAAQVAAGSRRTLMAAAVVVTVAVAAAGWMWMAGDSTSAVERPSLSVSTSPIAASPADEFTPAISPDAQWVVYALSIADDAEDSARTNFDLFLKSIDGQRTINLTETPGQSEIMPVYSPDGQMIAYVFVGPEGVGVGVMGATGENPRVIARDAWLGSWAPDSKTLVLADRGVIDPRSLSGTSTLWTIDIDSGDRNLVFAHDGWNALQPSLSPDGRHVAFWGLRPDGGGNRDVYTVPVSGGDPVVITHDTAVDFGPVWSRDGRFLYFSSDRSGSMNIWRVPMDPSSGEAMGSPDALTSGGLGDQMWLTIADSGSRLAYMDRLLRAPIVRTAFDPETLEVSEEYEQVSQLPTRAANPHISPDGRRVAYISYSGQQDIYVANIDGSNEQRVTNDGAKDWHPRWLDDNQTLVFYSDAAGTYELWKIGADGSGRTKLAVGPGNINFHATSRDGRFAAVSMRDVDEAGLFRLGDSPESSELTYLPMVPDVGKHAGFTAWSPDSQWLVGSADGVVMYHVQEQRFERLTSVAGDSSARFLPDGSGVLYANFQGGAQALWWIIDLESREARQLILPFPNITNLWIHPDGDSVVFVRHEDAESNVWLLEIGEGGR